MDYEEFLDLVMQFLPFADVCVDNDGQIIIYTGLRHDSTNYDNLIPWED